MFGIFIYVLQCESIRNYVKICLSSFFYMGDDNYNKIRSALTVFFDYPCPSFAKYHGQPALYSTRNFKRRQDKISYVKQRRLLPLARFISISFFYSLITYMQNLQSMTK